MKIRELFENSEKKSLYINRPLINTNDLIAWAKSQGIEKNLDPKDLHVTIAYSKEKVDWSLIKSQKNNIVVENGKRSLEFFGDGAVVLRFENEELRKRWQELRKLGANWEYADYKSHITLCYDSELDLSNIEPYKGKLIFGPEKIEEVDEDWSNKIKEK